MLVVLITHASLLPLCCDAVVCQDVADIITMGLKYRRIASTFMNISSSRSHCVLTIHLSQRFKDGSRYSHDTNAQPLDALGVVVGPLLSPCLSPRLALMPHDVCPCSLRLPHHSKVSHLNLVDLAGSERVSRSRVTGAALDEARSINQSLSALGNCIFALSSNNRSHIPYRDSKLTHLLKESIGGNCKTFLVITASLAAEYADETLSTLRFGSRAKAIKNRVRVNKQLSAEQLSAKLDALIKYVNVVEAERDTLRERVKALNAELQELPQTAASPHRAETRRHGAAMHKSPQPRRGGKKSKAGSGLSRTMSAATTSASSTQQRASAGGKNRLRRTASGTALSRRRRGRQADESHAGLEAPSGSGGKGARGAGGGEGGGGTDGTGNDEAPMQVFVKQRLQLEQQQQMIGDLVGELAMAQTKTMTLDVRAVAGCGVLVIAARL